MSDQEEKQQSKNPKKQQKRWKTYKLRMTVEVSHDSDGLLIARDPKGRTWNLTNQELGQYYKPI